MVVKNMDIWCISGDYNNINTTIYSNQVIIQNLKLKRKSTVPLKRIIKRNILHFIYTS